MRLNHDLNQPITKTLTKAVNDPNSGVGIRSFHYISKSRNDLAVVSPGCF